MAAAREGNLPYPMRAIRTSDFLYIHNLRAGPVARLETLGGLDDLNAEAPSHEALCWDTHAVFKDLDAGPTKAWLILNRAREDVRPLFEIAIGKRPLEELYDLRVDPDHMNNVADDPELRGYTRRACR